MPSCRFFFKGEALTAGGVCPPSDGKTNAEIDDFSGVSRMGNKLYVGNLPYKVRDGELGEMFAAYGNVASAKVMMERGTDRSKGFGFVEMSSDAEAQAAIAGMHGQAIGGRPLVVNEARPLEPRPPRQFGDRGDRGGYGDRGGNGGGFRSPYGNGGRSYDNSY